MKDYELLDAIGGIHPKYIESAEKTEPAGNKRVWKWLIPLAASLCFMIGCIGLWRRYEPEIVKKMGLTGGGSGLDETAAQVGSHQEAIDPVMASIAVFPDTEKLEDIENARLTDLTEADIRFRADHSAEIQESMPERMRRYLPSKLPTGFQFGHANLYETRMKNGTEYYMIRVTYTNQDQAENQTEGEDERIPSAMGDAFVVCVMNYRPDMDEENYTPESLPIQKIERNIYLMMDDFYISIFNHCGLSQDDLMIMVNSIN